MADDRTGSRSEDVLRTRHEATTRLPLRRADYARVTQDAREAAPRSRASDSRASRGHAGHAQIETVLRRQRATLATRRGRTQPRRGHSWPRRGHSWPRRGNTTIVARLHKGLARRALPWPPRLAAAGYTLASPWPLAKPVGTRGGGWASGGGREKEMG
jgi:hypothetical protein